MDTAPPQVRLSHPPEGVGKEVHTSRLGHELNLKQCQVHNKACETQLEAGRKLAGLSGAGDGTLLAGEVRDR